MKDSPMKNTSYYKAKHSESTEASALKFNEGGYTSHGPGSVSKPSPAKLPPLVIPIATAVISAAAAAKGAHDKKKAKHAAGMASAGSKAASGASMSQGISAGPKGGMG